MSVWDSNTVASWWKQHASIVTTGKEYFQHESDTSQLSSLVLRFSYPLVKDIAPYCSTLMRDTATKYYAILFTVPQYF